MDKKESLQLKGIAILMMLFLHLFNRPENVDLCDITLYFWNGKPLVSAMSRIASFCVPIYIFLSGYGLAITYEKCTQMNNINRIFRLYINYWVVFLLFIPLACLICPDDYPQDTTNFILNFIAYKSNYNYEWWFLFPYIVLVLCSKHILSFLYRLDKKRSIKTVILLFIFYISANLIAKQIKVYLIEYHLLQQLFWVISLSFMFVCGALFARYSLFDKIKEHFINSIPSNRKRTLFFLSVLCVLFILRMMLGPSVINPLFVIPFMACFLCMKRPKRLCSFLCYFGHHSTNMWLTHSFFIYYLFKDTFYGLRYPLVIYVALILVSLGSSYIVGWINKPVQRIIPK